MIAGKIRIGIAIATALTLTSVPMHAQSLLLENTRQSTAKPAAVEYLYPEQVTVPASKPTTIALHFRISPGLHINSHTPKEIELIPTTLTIPDGFGVRLDSASYPRGADFSLPLDPKTKLSVYTGEFILQARITATAGNHLVEARLRYQACDNNACMPPKTITAAIYIIAKEPLH
jgi:hypothetical protein